MWRPSYLAVLICLASGLTWHGHAATVPMPNPEEGAVKNSVFTNEYFNLSYPLPLGWTEGVPGPGPSRSGYYVLSTLTPARDFSGTILIAAQDMFFAVKPFGDAAAMALELSRATSEIDGMTIDRAPSEVLIAGRRFIRIDFSGVGLFRSTLITEIRCHLVSFNLTAKSPELLAALALSLNDLGQASSGDAKRVDPICTSNYADSEYVLTNVDPAASGPNFIPIPVRIIVGVDGGVKHVHVIRAVVGQRDSIKSGLGQWRFKPHVVDGRASEIETGLLIEFGPSGSIKYSTRSQNLLNSPGQMSNGPDTDQVRSNQGAEK
jgi:hypothetical protein